jgi:predicted ribosome quality control (RQC) complex YloA/Tae2 family protein
MPLIPPSEQELLESAKALARAPLTKERRRLARRIEAIQGDLAKGVLAQEEADKARWFVAAASSAPRGARALTATDASTGDLLSLPLDPARPAREQIEAIFSSARRMQRGAEIARGRLAEAEASLGAVVAKQARIDAAESQADLDAVLLEDQRPQRAALHPRPPRGKEPKRRPYRLFESRLGAPILVGKRAADNDALTFKVARPRDLWLHARGIEGAHVVLPLAKGKEPTPSDLVDAAHLAAHFSGHRSEATVEVDYATRGHVRKPRGSPPGLVVLDHGKTLLVRLEPERLAALLASEERKS